MHRQIPSLPLKHMKNGELVSLMLMVLSWESTIALSAVHLIGNPPWLTPTKWWIALGVSTLLSLYHTLWGQRRIHAIQKTKGHQQLYITPWQAALVVAIVVGFSAFVSALCLLPI